MSHKDLNQARDASAAPAIHTTLLSLVQALSVESHDEYWVCDRVVDLLEGQRVVLTGTLRNRRITREDLHDG
jgi:hypothetical protein